MENDFCIGCDQKEECMEPCQDLQAYLLISDCQPLSGSSTLSGDYMDKIFASTDIPETELEQERRLRKERKERGKAIDKLITYFGKITGEEGKSLKYFFIWKLKVEERLKDREIADIIGLSRQRINQILSEIKL